MSSLKLTTSRAQAWTPGADEHPPAHKKTASPSGGMRMCGNCGVLGHQAVTCKEPCFACGGDHKFYQCDDPVRYVAALRQASRNRVGWAGYNAKKHIDKGRTGMKDSHAGQDWVRKEFDPGYTPARDLSPKRMKLNKLSHASDRCRAPLRSLWSMPEGIPRARPWMMAC